MSGQSTALSPRAELAARVAELNDLVVFGSLDDAELRTLTDEVAGLLAGTGQGRRPWWESPQPDLAYRSRSPIAGVENPRAPSVRFDSDTSDDGTVTMAAEVNLGKAFAGPPGAVHGGVIAGLFDEIVGATAGANAPGRVVVTGKLSVRYRVPTPLRTPLRFEASLGRRSSRLLEVSAACRAADTLTATAEALMVVR